MTRWHTDRPIRPLREIRAPAPVAAVDMFQTTGPARGAMQLARAFYRRKLRKRAREQEEQAGDHPTPTVP
jgi:hypothetical protein